MLKVVAAQEGKTIKELVRELIVNKIQEVINDNRDTGIRGERSTAK